MFENAHRCSDSICAAVVEQAPPTACESSPRKQDGHLGLAVSGRIGRKLERSTGQSAIRALDDVERQPRQPEASPFALQGRGLFRVYCEVDDPQRVRGECPRVLDRSCGREVESVDEHDHRVTPQDGRFARVESILFELGLLGGVLPVQQEQGYDAEGKQYDDYPGPFTESWTLR